ncbi:CYTH domain-containing protein [Planococcus sp. CAU13]|uniref:CYTH domain-containing protein n=1 Tax=Planococcus sp. CAU13 TaxID=1541197 RepID=UPI00052FED1B|nr:CYTH domain-containing protein [Planococcus sp. CAU13]
MTKELEIEFKNLLTEDEYVTLTALFGFSPEDAQTQINHYFDTVDFRLREQKSALRIRQKDNAFECTLKTPAENGYYEITDALPRQQAEDIINGRNFAAPEVSEVLKEQGILPGELVLLGSLTTHRIEFTYDGGLLVLDRSQYHGTEDFEVEFEVTDFNDGKEKFRKLLEDNKIPVRRTDKKIARFMAAAKKR